MYKKVSAINNKLNALVHSLNMTTVLKSTACITKKHFAEILNLRFYFIHYMSCCIKQVISIF